MRWLCLALLLLYVGLGRAQEAAGTEGEEAATETEAGGEKAPTTTTEDGGMDLSPTGNCSVSVAEGLGCCGLTIVPTESMCCFGVPANPVLPNFAGLRCCPFRSGLAGALYDSNLFQCCGGVPVAKNFQCCKPKQPKGFHLPVPPGLDCPS